MKEFERILSLLKKNRLAAIILTIVLIFVLYWLFDPAESGLLFTLQRGEFLIDIKVEGEVKALDSYVVKAPSNIWGNARIVTLAPEGTLVKEGDLLVQFDASEFLQRLMEAQNRWETTRANLASTQANIKSQMSELESNIELEKYSLEQSRLRAKNAVYESDNKRKEIEFNLKKAEISYQQLTDRKLSSEKINQATLRQAELEVEQALIKLKRAQDDLEKMTIKSPTQGLIVYNEVWEGNRMAKLKVGYSPWRGQPLMEIPTQNKMKVSIKVNEVDISRLAKEQQVFITLDAVPDTLFTGVIKEIAALARRDNKTNKNIFDAEVYLNESDEWIKPGMTAHCQIIVRRLENKLFVPIDAVQTIEGRALVYDEDGDAREISAGLSNSDFIVVESGLSEGDKVRIQTAPSQKSEQKQSGKNNKPLPKPERVVRRVIIG